MAKGGETETRRGFTRGGGRAAACSRDGQYAHLPSPRALEPELATSRSEISHLILPATLARR